MYGIGFIVIGAGIAGAFIVRKIRGFVNDSEIDSLIKEGEYEAALNKCLQKAENGKSTPELDYKIFSILKKLESDECFQWAKKIADQTAKSKKSLLEALEYLKKYSYESNDAALKFEVLLKKDYIGDLSADETFEISAVYGAARNYEKFQKYIKKAMKLSGNNFLYIKLYTIFCFERNLEKDAAEILSSYEGSVENKTELYSIAGEYWLKKKPEQASRWFGLIDRLTDAGVNKAIAQIALSINEICQSDFSAAREYIDNAKTMKNKIVPSYNNLCLICDALCFYFYEKDYFYVIDILRKIEISDDSDPVLNHGEIKKLIHDLETSPAICSKELMKIMYYIKNGIRLQSISGNLDSYAVQSWKDIEASVKLWKNRIRDVFKGRKSIFKSADLLMMNDDNFINVVSKIPNVSGVSNVRIISDTHPFIYSGVDKRGFRTLSMISKKSDCFNTLEINEFAEKMKTEKAVKGFMSFLGKIDKSMRDYAIEKNIILNDKYVIDEYLRLI